MTNLSSFPMQDAYETTLSQAWNGAVGTVFVSGVPSFTFPASTTTYIVVAPGKSNMQVAKINAYDGTLKTLTVTSITVNKGAGLPYTQQSHAVGETVMISDNFGFWEDIKTAFSTKLDSDIDTTMANTKKLQFGTSVAYIKTDDAGVNLLFKDGSNIEVNLSTMLSGGGADQKVAVSAADTTTSFLNVKLTAGDGLSKTIINPGGAEVLDLDIDLADTTIFVSTSSGAGDSGKIARLDGTGKFPAGFINVSASSLFGGDSSDGVQPDSDLTITGSNNTLITKNFSSWTAGSVSRTLTVTPTGCIVYIKIKGNADFTNRTFDFDGKGRPGGASGNNSPGGTGESSTALFDLSVNGGGVGSTAIGSGGGGGAGSGADGSNGGGGSAGAGGVKGLSMQFVQEQKRIIVMCGAGGGGGSANASVNGGIGGTGGGVLVIEVGGNITFSSTVMTSTGDVGINGANGSGGGGGGGGVFLILYSGTLTGTSTPTVSGGAAGGNGGAGGAGDYLIAKNLTRF